MPRALRLRPHAKINLTLHVGPPRPDGYHDVQTLLQSVALADTVVLTPRRGAFAIACRTPGVPTDRTNLIWRAAAELWRAIGRTGDPRDVAVTLRKRIPSGAGLGGGSADAAAALVGLNRLWRGELTVRDLVAIGASIGSDVPFFFVGGTAMGSGRGEHVVPLADLPPMAVVLIAPAFAVPTKSAYGWFDADASLTLPDAPDIFDAGWPFGPIRLMNSLQAPVARRHPEIGEALAALRRSGAMAAAMTGSGSVVFGLFSRSAAIKAAKRVARPGWRVVVTRTASRRVSGRGLGLC